MNLKKVQEAENQIYELRKTVRYDIRELTIEIIVMKYEKGLGYYSEMSSEESREYTSSLWVPDYQRDFTWDEERQSRFIESVLLGLPVPLIFVAENKDSIWEIVDGSQRIRTLVSFLNNQLTLKNLEKLNKLNGFKFLDLDSTRQGKFKDMPIRMIVLTEEATEDVKKDMFERINKGSDLLKPMEKRKGIIKGPFNDFIYKQCSPLPLFEELAPIDKWLKNRQEKEELILRYFALSEYYKDYPKNKGIAKFLDDYLKDKNTYLESLTKEKQTEYLNYFYNDFCKMLDFVNKSSQYGFRVRQSPQTKRAVFEAISVGVHIALQKKSNLKVSKEKFSEIVGSPEFMNLTIGNVAYKGAYTPQQVKERVEYLAKQLLK